MSEGMLNPIHPDDEFLSALASHDGEAAGDGALTDHVATCDRCSTFVDELRALRTWLAELPDLQPSRPLRLVPAVEPEGMERDDRLAGWVRRIFGPALAAGAALAMIGLIGTAAPALDGIAAGPFTDIGREMSGAGASPDTVAEGEPLAPGARDDDGDGSTTGAPDHEGVDTNGVVSDLPAERSPWPMVLFAGVALMIGIAMLRWILVPRAG
jgi:anti-sigma factor RsiW